MIWGRPATRVDERDTMFARAARSPGTPPYVDYYGRHPERWSPDDRLRAMPALLEPGGRAFDEAIAAEARDWFRRIDTWAPGADATRLGLEIAEAADPADALKAAALSLGAVAAGCCDVDSAFAYSRKGRFDADYGREVDLEHHRSALVFLVEMDFAAMQRAPRAEVIRESARQYFRAAVIARTIAAALGAAGIEAAAQYDAHYDVILPPLAVAAGLGELGRHNLLVADRFGTRVRIGAVTTGIRLRADGRRDLGVERFCLACRKCADNCPPRALFRGSPTTVNGVEKWPTDAERCYGYWRLTGTDCGICMAVCPFSHQNTAVHNVVRRLSRALPQLAPVLVWADDVVYGRQWNRGREPATRRAARRHDAGGPPTGS